MNMNPVLSREIRQRFRRGRAPVFFTVWLLVVGAFTYLIYLAGRAFAQSFGNFGVGSFASSAALGRMMFELTAILIMTAVLFIVPGVMALSVVSERERLTLKLLQISQLRPWQIVAGKLSSGLAYVLLLIVAAGPVLLLPVILGGVGIGEVFAALGITLVTAITLGSISVWMSARAKTTRGAVAGSYVWAFVLAVGTLIVLVAEVLLIQPGGRAGGGPDGREFYSVWPNPYVAMVSAVNEPVEAQGGVLFGTPFTTAGELLARRQGEVIFGGFDVAATEPFGRGGVVFEEQAIGQGDPRDLRRGPIWIRTVIIDLIIIGLTSWFAARAVAAPEPPRLLRRRHAPRAGPVPEVSDAVA